MKKLILIFMALAPLLAYADNFDLPGDKQKSGQVMMTNKPNIVTAPQIYSVIPNNLATGFPIEILANNNSTQGGQSGNMAIVDVNPLGDSEYDAVNDIPNITGFGIQGSLDTSTPGGIGANTAYIYTQKYGGGATTTGFAIWTNINGVSTPGFFEDSNDNVGIGTYIPAALFDVKRKFDVVSGGNVGIGSLNPGQVLDVQGTVRATGFTGNASNLTNLPITLTTTGSSGASTWTQGTNTLNIPQYTGGGSSNWIYTSSGNIGLSTTASVGIGTTFIGGTGEGALSVMNGNVGIGTWIPAALLTVNGSSTPYGIYTSGNIGVGSLTPLSALVMGSGGHIRSDGVAPTVAVNDCGSTVQGTVSAGATDIKGSFVVGTLTVTSCAVTFNTAFNRAPICITQDDTNVLGVKTTTTTTKMTTVASTSMSGDTITYVCVE